MNERTNGRLYTDPPPPVGESEGHAEGSEDESKGAEETLVVVLLRPLSVDVGAGSGILVHQLGEHPEDLEDGGVDYGLEVPARRVLLTPSSSVFYARFSFESGFLSMNAHYPRGMIMNECDGGGEMCMDWMKQTSQYIGGAEKCERGKGGEVGGG